MPPETPSQILNVYLLDEETDEETLIGKIEYASDGRLTVLESAAEHEVFLTNTVDGLNAKEVLVEKVPPPPTAPKFAVHSRVVQRTDEDFFPTLQAYMRRYYGLSLG